MELVLFLSLLSPCSAEFHYITVDWKSNLQIQKKNETCYKKKTVNKSENWSENEVMSTENIIIFQWWFHQSFVFLFFKLFIGFFFFFFFCATYNIAYSILWLAKHDWQRNCNHWKFFFKLKIESWCDQNVIVTDCEEEEKIYEIEDAMQAKYIIIIIKIKSNREIENVVSHREYEML